MTNQKSFLLLEHKNRRRVLERWFRRDAKESGLYAENSVRSLAFLTGHMVICIYYIYYIPYSMFSARCRDTKKWNMVSAFKNSQYFGKPHT